MSLLPHPLPSLLSVTLALCGPCSLWIFSCPLSLALLLLVSSSLAPESLAPESLAPESLVPESLAPESLAPESLAPESLAP
eukprot:1392507-Amorphochlora_amoeboformis.AAC.1